MRSLAVPASVELVECDRAGIEVGPGSAGKVSRHRVGIVGRSFLPVGE